MNILKLLRLASSLNWSVYESDLDLIERVNTNNVFDGMAKNNKKVIIKNQLFSNCFFY